MRTITRRKFAQVISMSGVSGIALMEKMQAEMQISGSISTESVRSFLDISGTKMRDDDVYAVQASLERALDSMRRIRERSIAQTREPAVMFRVRR